MKSMTEKAEILAQIPMFDLLNEDETKVLMGIMERRVAKRFSNIYDQDEESDALYILASGTVKIAILNDEGREMIKRILHPVMMFGEHCLFSDERQSNYAMAMNSDVTYFRIRATRFKALMQSNPQLGFRVLSMIGRRLRHTERRLESLVFKDARSRIIDFLKENAQRRGRKVGFETFFKHCYTQQDIANFTGTSRQTVTSVLNDLRKSNQIYFNRRSILIRDMANLS